MNLIDELFGRPKMKGKIIVEVDDDREKAETTIEGTFPTVLTMISLICSELHKHGIPKELIRGAVDIGFDEKILRDAIKFGLKERPYFNKNIVVKEIKVDKNKAKDIEELLNKLMED